MIDVKISAHGMARFEVMGNDLEIASEIGSLISQVYSQTKAVNPKAAEQFRAILGVMLLPDSPVWALPPIKGDGVVSAVIPCGKRGEGPGPGEMRGQNTGGQEDG